jgi:hypothetical protein
MIDRDEIVRARRRREALETLELERQRDAAISARLESSLRDLEAWRADELAFGRIDSGEADLLRQIGFAAQQPPEDGRVRLESRVAELEAELAESRRRQRALERFAEALGE